MARTILGLVVGIVAGLLVQVALLVLAVRLVRLVNPEVPAPLVVLGFLGVQVLAVLLTLVLLARQDTIQMEALAAQAIRDRGIKLEPIRDMEAVPPDKERNEPDA